MSETQLLSFDRRLESLQRYEKPVVWVAAASLFLLAGTIFLNRHFFGYNNILLNRHYDGTLPLFWDLSVYVAAAQALASGLDPYDPAVLQQFGAGNFTSPPVIAWLLKGIVASHTLPLLKPTLLLLHIGAMIGIPIALGRLFFGKEPERLALAVAAFLLLFKDAGVVALGAVNNGTFLYWWIVAATVVGFERDRWASFHASVLFASLFKPFYVLFWILPILARRFSFKHLAIAAVGTVMAACCSTPPLVADPTVFQRWLANLTYQTLDHGDAGQNVFAMVKLLIGPEGIFWAPFAAQVLFDALLATLLLTTPTQGRTRWALLIIAAVFMNPRVMPYDSAIASIPLAFLAAQLLPPTLPREYRLAISVLGLAALLLILPSKPMKLVPEPILFPLVVSIVLVWVDLRARRTFSSQ
jgi:hypothetical protein